MKSTWIASKKAHWRMAASTIEAARSSPICATIYEKMETITWAWSLRLERVWISAVMDAPLGILVI